MSNNVMKIQMLEEEIEVLRGRIEEHDTGHIHTTIGVLQERVRELYNQPTNKNNAETND